MIIKNFIEPPIDNNNYLLIDEESREAALVDCSSVDDRIWEELKNNNVHKDIEQNNSDFKENEELKKKFASRKNAKPNTWKYKKIKIQ